MNKKLNIIFVGGYQGPKLVVDRNIIRNRSLAGTNKIRAICTALAMRGHKVSIYSVGGTAERSGRWYKAMKETIKMNAGDYQDIDVWYGESLDVKILGGLISDLMILKWLPRMFRQTKYNAAIIYNLNPDSLLTACYLRFVRKIPVILEYEDSIVTARCGQLPIWKKGFVLFERIGTKLINGVYAPSPELVEVMKTDNGVVVPGALSKELVQAACNRLPHSEFGERLKVLYCGNLDPSKGVDLLMDAVELIEHPLEVNICGKGPLAEELKARCEKCRHPAIFHGVVSNEKLIELQTNTDIAVNPHRINWHKGTLWPFKVVEYLAACGVVICARTGKIEKDLEENLYLYHSDDPAVLAEKIKSVITDWENVRRAAPSRMDWAIGKWGPEGIGKTIETLLLRAEAFSWRFRRC